MQINKKLITMAITALLLLSMLAVAVPAYAAPGVTSVTDSNPWALAADSGFVGDKVRIIGTAVAGGLVSVYWDNVGGTLLNTTYATGAGAYEIYVTIPDAVMGGHFLIVTDSTGSVGAGFTVNPLLVASPTSGIAGDTITLTGTGFQASKAISVDFATEHLITTGVTTSATGFFTTTIAVPSTVGGNPIAYQGYVITAFETLVPANDAIAIFTVGASVSLSTTSGPAGTIVTITGRGFTHSAANSLVSILFDGVAPTNLTTIRRATDGTFTGTFVVPSGKTVGTTYVVSASDGVDTGATSGTGSFKVTGDTVFSTVASAAPGATVTVTGSNFTAQAGTVVRLNFGVLTNYATFTTDANGAFSEQMTVPQITVGTYSIVVTDANGCTDTVTFRVAITSISLNATSATVGSLIVVSGYGFTAGDQFNVTFAGIVVVPKSGGSLIQAGTPTTLPTGTQFVIPTIGPNTYSVTVTDVDGLTATTELTVTATSTLVVNPTQAPKNIAVTITATNFGDASTLAFFIYNSTWSSALTVTEANTYTAYTTKYTGKFVGTFTISATNIALGTYTINASNTNSGYVNRFNATVSFTLGLATLNIAPRADSYRQGDIVSFNVQSSYKPTAPAVFTINIADPEGTPATLALTETSFVQLSDLYVVVLNGANFQLSDDAVVGTWSWNITVSGAGTKRGNFEVTQGISEELTDISDKLDSMNVTLVSVKDNVVTIKTDVGTIKTTLAAIDAKIVALDGKVVTLDTKVGTVQTSITSLPGTIQTSVQNGLATITTSIGTITTKLDSIDAVLGSVAGEQATLSTSIGTVTTTLTALNAKVVSIEDNVATIVTDVGTLQGVVTQIQGDVASIDTGVGTIQTSVANIQPEVTTAKDNTSSMSTMIYVAVAFAIIAAIAAVASILLMRKKIAS